MSEISVLFQLGFSDSMVAARLGVARMTANRWRRGLTRPRPEDCLKARMYLGQIRALLQPVTDCNTPL